MGCQQQALEAKPACFPAGANVLFSVGCSKGGMAVHEQVAHAVLLATNLFSLAASLHCLAAHPLSCLALLESEGEQGGWHQHPLRLGAGGL